MKKLLLISTALFLSAALLNSCGSKEKEGDKADADSWSEENKTKFVEECAKGGAPEATCKCMVDKMAEKFSTVSEAKKAMESDKEVAMNMAMECL